MISLDIPFLHKEQIIEKANIFLSENNLYDIPVDIEFVAEKAYGVNIVPFPNLKHLFGIDGFSAFDFSSIYVDEYAYTEVPNRMRFTIAHEMAHRILHKSYLNKLSWSNCHEWMDVYTELDKKDIQFMEFQADTFAGLVLVPQQHLCVEFKEQLALLEPQMKQAKDNGLRRDEYVEFVRHAIANELSRKFEVSRIVMSIRMEFDSLVQEIQ